MQPGGVSAYSPDRLHPSGARQNLPDPSEMRSQGLPQKPPNMITGHFPLWGSRLSTSRPVIIFGVFFLRLLGRSRISLGFGAVWRAPLGCNRSGLYAETPCACTPVENHYSVSTERGYLYTDTYRVIFRCTFFAPTWLHLEPP